MRGGCAGRSLTHSLSSGSRHLAIASLRLAADVRLTVGLNLPVYLAQGGLGAAGSGGDCCFVMTCVEFRGRGEHGVCQSGRRGPLSDFQRHPNKGILPRAGGSRLEQYGVCLRRLEGVLRMELEVTT